MDTNWAREGRDALGDGDAHRCAADVCLHDFSRVRLFATPWTVARQAPSVHGILQARILQWVAVSSSRGPSRPRE